MQRTMRELVAYSKLINLSERERAKFQAALLDKKIDFPSEVSEPSSSRVVDRIRELEKRTADKNGFKQ